MHLHFYRVIFVRHEVKPEQYLVQVPISIPAAGGHRSFVFTMARPQPGLLRQRPHTQPHILKYAPALRDVRAGRGQAHPHRRHLVLGAIGGITSSRCTDEEVYVVQKMVRAAFGNNNVDTCARVCHSPTGYGLKQTFGTSAGTQDFKSVDSADVMVVIGANPTDGHLVFASRMKQRLRQGAKLIVLDPRRIDRTIACDVEDNPLVPGPVRDQI